MIRTLAMLFVLGAGAAGAANAIDVSKAVDLTHTFDKDTIYWPTSDGFDWKQTAWGKNDAGFWYTSASYGANEHGGTHLDSPIHFHEKGATTEQIPIQDLIAPAVVIDIGEACAKDADYRLSAADIAAWEKRHGRIPDGAILMVRTGWGSRWPDKKRYMGTDRRGDVANLHFPGLSKEAAEFLTKGRRLKGVGIDTASLDYGPSKDFIVHRVLMGAGLYGLENVANLERLPAKGATVIALPMKIKGGTGGPVRIVALLP